MSPAQKRVGLGSDRSGVPGIPDGRHPATKKQSAESTPGIDAELTRLRTVIVQRVAALKNAARREIADLERSYAGALAKAEAELTRLAERIDELERRSAARAVNQLDAHADKPRSESERPRGSKASRGGDAGNLAVETVADLPRSQSSPGGKGVVVGRATPVPRNQRREVPKPQPIADLLASHGFEVYDRRDRPGGSLWVLGPRARVLPVLKSLESRGVQFTWAVGGGKATGGRPAWFTKNTD